MNVIVTAAGRGALLDFGSGPRRAAVGRSGVGIKEREGDGLTPVGTFPFRRVMFRGDRVFAPRTRLKLWPIIKGDAWCDAPDDVRYNAWVRTPYPASTETLYRDDHLYDIVVELGFNDDPVVAGKGSAIFLHVARPDYGPTEGCIALSEPDLVELLTHLAPGDTITVQT